MHLSTRTARFGVAAAALTGVLALAACGGSDNGGAASSTDKIGVSLITKDSTQPVLRRHAEGRQGGRHEEQRRADRRLRQGGG